jgi:short-subunit dehydrogenase
MRVLVTGCGSGIGRATAIEMSKRGHDVTATTRRRGQLAGLEVSATLELDVDDPSSIALAVEQAGHVDVLVNAAGFGVRGPVEKVPIEEARGLFETCFFGPLRLIQAVLPGMRGAGFGVIVTVSSVAGRQARPLQGLYAAVKSASESMSEALSYEVERTGVRVLIVEPGLVATGFARSRRHFGEDAPPYRELANQWDAVLSSRAPIALTPEAVAVAIADAIEAPAARLRLVIGLDAEEIIRRRLASTDEEYRAWVWQSMERGHD